MPQNLHILAPFPDDLFRITVQGFGNAHNGNCLAAAPAANRVEVLAGHFHGLGQVCHCLSSITASFVSVNFIFQ